MIVAALLLACAALTPEQEVEAWEPNYVEREIDEGARRDGNLRVASVAVPLLSTVGGAVSGVVAAYATYAIAQNGLVGVIVGPAVGIAAYAAYLAGGLALFLPRDLPSWSVPVAVVAGTSGAIAGAVFGGAIAFAYVQNAYPPGSDCFCGPDLIIIPLAPLTFAALGGAVATAVSVGVADAAVE